MQTRPLTDREVGALMVLGHLLIVCRSRNATQVPISLAFETSIVGALSAEERQDMSRRIEAALQHKLLGRKADEVYVTDRGSVLFAFSELAGSEASNFEEETRDHAVLESVLSAVNGDHRFDPPRTNSADEPGQVVSVSNRQEDLPEFTAKFWVGAVIMLLLILGALHASLKH